jgi:two-component system response regulator NreC
VADAPEATRLAEGRPIEERPIGVVLADDHPGVRRSLRAVLDGEEDMEVLAEAGDFEETARVLRLHRPHVLVVDLWSSDGASPATIGDLHTRAPQTRIVVVTMNDSPASARALLGAGAAGFVLKELADSDLPRAVRAAADGEVYVSPRIAGRLRAQSHGRAAVGGESGQSATGSGQRDTGSRQRDRNNT